MQIEDVQKLWEVPAVAHFCSLFRQVFNLIDFDIEDFEEALLADTLDTQGGGRCSLIVDLLVSLLRGMPGGRDVSLLNYNQHLHTLLEYQWVSTGCGETNPLGPDVESASIHRLPLYSKLKLLHWLCEYRLQCPDVEHATRNLSGESLRVHPLGQDNDGNTYWYFYGTRLYKEEKTPMETFKAVKKEKVTYVKKPVRSARKRRKANAYDFGRRRKKRPVKTLVDEDRKDEESDNSESEMGSQLSTVSSSRGPSPSLDRSAKCGRSPRKSAGAEGNTLEEGDDGLSHDTSLNDLVQRMYSCDNDDDDDEDTNVADTTADFVSLSGDSPAIDDLETSLDTTVNRTIMMDESSVTELEGSGGHRENDDNLQKSKLIGKPSSSPNGDFEFTYVDEGGDSLPNISQPVDLAVESEFNHSSASTKVNVGSKCDLIADGASTEISENLGPKDMSKDIKPSQLGGDDGVLGSIKIESPASSLQNLAKSKSEDLGADGCLKHELLITDSDNTSFKEFKLPAGPPPWDQPGLRQPEVLRWSLACGTMEDWTNLVNLFENAESKVESELYSILKNDFHQAIEDLFKQREKELQKKITDLGQRRCSDRIELRKLQRQKENQDLEQREKSERLRMRQLNEEKRMVSLKEERETRAKEREARAKEREKDREKLRLVQEQNKEERTRRLEARQRRLELSAEGKPIPPELLAESTGRIGIVNDREMSEIEKEVEYDCMIGQLDKVLQAVQNDTDAWPFLEPVTEEIAPSYFDLIENPMDLGTIESKLEAREYKTKMEFVNDLNTMFLNCLHYNGLDSDYTKIAHRLERAMITAWKQYFPLADLHDLSSDRRKEELETIKLLGALDREVKASLNEISLDEQKYEFETDEPFALPPTEQISTPVALGVPPLSAALMHTYGANPIKRAAAMLRTDAVSAANNGVILNEGEDLITAITSKNSSTLITKLVPLADTPVDSSQVSVVSSADVASSYERPGFERNPFYLIDKSSPSRSRPRKQNLTKQHATVPFYQKIPSIPGNRVVLVSTSPARAKSTTISGNAGPGIRMIQPKFEPYTSQAEFNESNLPFNRLMKLETSDRLHKSKQTSSRTPGGVRSPQAVVNNAIQAQSTSSTKANPTAAIRAASICSVANGSPVAHVLINGKLVPVRITSVPAASSSQPGSSHCSPVKTSGSTGPMVSALQGVQLLSPVRSVNTGPSPIIVASQASQFQLNSPQPVNVGVRKVGPGNNVMTISLVQGGMLSGQLGNQLIQLGKASASNFVSNAPDNFFVMAASNSGNGVLGQQILSKLPSSSCSSVGATGLGSPMPCYTPEASQSSCRQNHTQRVVNTHTLRESLGGNGIGQSLPIILPDGKTSIQRGKDGFIYTMERTSNGELILQAKYSDDNLPDNIAQALAQSMGTSAGVSAAAPSFSGQAGISLRTEVAATSNTLVFSSPMAVHGHQVAVAAAVMGGHSTKPVCSVTPQPRQTLANPSGFVLSQGAGGTFQAVAIQAPSSQHQFVSTGMHIQQPNQVTGAVLAGSSGQQFTAGSVPYGRVISSTPQQQVFILQSPPHSGSSFGVSPWTSHNGQSAALINVASIADSPAMVMSGAVNTVDQQLLNFISPTRIVKQSAGSNDQQKPFGQLSMAAPVQAGNLLGQLQQQAGPSGLENISLLGSGTLVSADGGQTLHQIGCGPISNAPVQFIQVMQPQIVVNTIPQLSQVSSLAFQPGPQATTSGGQQVVPRVGELGDAPALLGGEGGPGSPDLLTQAWNSIQDS